MAVFPSLAVFSGVSMLLFLLIFRVEGNYTLSVQTLSYVNLQSMCWSCDSPPMKATCCMNVGMECGQCDSQFQYCVGNGRSNCVTSSIDRTGNITFSTGQVLGLSNPLLFEGTSTTWMDADVTVRVRNFDSDELDGLIDRFVIKITAATVMVGVPVNNTYRGEHDIATIQLKFLVECAPGFTGVSCGDLESPDTCLDRGCVEGVCSNGTCICSSGYMGPTCAIEVCEHTMCGNGTCVPHDTTYKCECPPGVMGETCNITNHCYNACNDQPCENRLDSFVCSCPDGVSGTSCEIKDHCYGMMCGAGECEVTGENTPVCVCRHGYTGLRCETRDVCQTADCNHGQCLRDGGDGFTCVCDTGYTGRSCDVSLLCENVSCSGSGQCMSTPDSSSSYMCVCVDGYTGLLCEDLVPEAQPFMTLWVGTAVGVFVGVVLLLLLVTIVIVVLIRKSPQRTAPVVTTETAAWSKPDASPGDNPTYMPITEPTYDTIGQRREEREERSFHNPQYGVPDIEMACAYEVPMTTSGRHDGDLTSGGNDGSLRKGSDVGERTFHNPQYGAPRKVAMGTSQTTPTQQKGSLYREPIHVVPSSHPMEYEVPSKTLPT